MTAVGVVAVSAQALHILGIHLLGTEDRPGLPALLGSVAVAALHAQLWTRRFLCGPLEQLVHEATGLARHAR